MSTQLVRRVWCDQHEKLKDEQVPGQGYVVALDGHQVEIDLCADCADPLLALQRFLDTYGRPVAKTERKGSTGGSAECPACGKRLRSRTGLQAHFRGQHGTTLAEWEAQHIVADDEGTPEKVLGHTCDVEGCGRSFATAAGLARHRTRKHP